MKTKSYTYYLFFFWITILCFSCSENIESIVLVHENLQAHFDNFEIEGQNRGIDIDLKSAEIQGFMENINDLGVVGQCIESHAEGKRIVIDSDRWRRLTNSQKEFIVFHELGHCYLNRSHTDEKGSDGSCLSIMHSSTEACENKYNPATREDYLDELFLN